MPGDLVAGRQAEIIRLCRDEHVPPGEIAGRLGVSKSYVFLVLEGAGVRVRDSCPSPRNSCLDAIRRYLSSPDSPGFTRKIGVWEKVPGCGRWVRHVTGAQFARHGVGQLVVRIPRVMAFLYYGERGLGNLLNYLAGVFADYMAEHVFPRWRRRPSLLKIRNYVTPRTPDWDPRLVDRLISLIVARLEERGVQVARCNGPCINEIVQGGGSRG